jgi:predicted dehydrogenase
MDGSGFNGQGNLDVLHTGVVGAGSFGGCHAGKLAASCGSLLEGVFDPDQDRARLLAKKHGARAFASLDALIESCDALIVAAPACAHAEIAARALEAGRHVLVEKPLAATPDDAEHLVRLAYRHGVVLQAGHQERFVMDAIGLLRTPQPPLRIESVREGPPSGRGTDVSVTLDLMIHDLDLVAMVFGSTPLAIHAEATGQPGRWDHVEARLTFAAGSATLTASRVAPARRRSMRAEFASGAVQIDFLTRTMRNTSGLDLDPNFGEKAPDPLGMSVEAFLAAARGKASCAAPGEAGAAAVRLAAAIDQAALRLAA